MQHEHNDAWADELGDSPPAPESRQNGHSKAKQVKQPSSSKRASREIQLWRPFPTASLPCELRRFVAVAARAMQCDESFIALPALTSCAAAIGSTRMVQIKRGWLEPPVMWSALIGESGTLKTPALRIASRPLRDLQLHLFNEHEQLITAHEIDKSEHERAYAKWKKGGGGDPPQEPKEPPQSRVLISDVTVEAVASILQHNPRGLLLIRDELAAWLGGFDRYTRKGGGDVAQWLSTHSGEPITVDRRSSGTIHIPRAFVSITGGIQPETLRRALGHEHIANGLAARLLMAFPLRPVRKWSEDDIPPENEARYASIIEGLRELQPDNATSEYEPTIVRLDADARELWRSYFDRHAAEQADQTGALASAWSKLEGGAARLALIIHLVRWASGEPVSDTGIDGESMSAGITLADWFKSEARRVYNMLGESDDETADRELVEWIRRRGGCVTARDLTRGPRRFRGDPEAATTALDDLANMGYGELTYPSPGQQGGHPAKVFTLTGYSGDSDTTPHIDANNDGSVAVACVTAMGEEVGE